VARNFTIGNHEICDDGKCYVIAEVGHNHQGNLKTCMELFKSAKECGVSAVKLQKRNNRALYTKAMFDKPYENENSYGPTYGAHREALEFNADQYKELQQYCKELGIDFFATAFDFDSADLLAALDVPAFKMASGDLKNTPLLRHVARFGKPMIVSTGGATMDDVKRAHDTVLAHNPQLCLLQCTAEYPADFKELNLRVIATYRETFPESAVGFSGHDSGIAMAVAAFMLGARVVEKHFTLNRAWKGTDHAFSLEPVGMRKLVRDLERTWMAMGDGIKRPYPSEVSPIIKMGKKLVAARNLPAGHVLTAEDIVLKSPGDGIPPYELENVIGRKTLQPLIEDETITFEVIGKK
jgi:sialic acid synthase